MKYILLALVFALPASADAPVLENTADNVRQLFQGFKKQASEAPQLTAAALGGITMEWDCETVIFEKDSPGVSDPVALRTRTWIEECRNIPGAGCIPSRRLMRTDRRSVFIEIPGRPVPGPREEFRVCLHGPWLSLKIVSSPNEYNVEEKEDRFTLTRQD